MIGGSMGLAIKKKRLAREVVGVGHRRSSINKALKLKTIDSGTLDPVKGVKGADIVVLATPILLMESMVRRIAPYLKKGCIITDVGSSKAVITKKIETLLPKGVSFVGAHPMAGSEKRGVEIARTDLFRNSICILTRTGRTRPASLGAVRRLWASIGARVVILSPKTHDAIVSGISHLPHMVMFALASGVDKKSVRFASTGFKDSTRIASSDPYIWKDIAVSNKGEILRSINRFKGSLTRLEKAIRRQDGAALVKFFKTAKEKRELSSRGAAKRRSPRKRGSNL